MYPARCTWEISMPACFPESIITHIYAICLMKRINLFQGLKNIHKILWNVSFKTDRVRERRDFESCFHTYRGLWSLFLPLCRFSSSDLISDLGDLVEGFISLFKLRERRCLRALVAHLLQCFKSSPDVSKKNETLVGIIHFLLKPRTRWICVKLTPPHAANTSSISWQNLDCR